MAKVGRPVGFKLSEDSKRRISKSKTGQLHSSKTKERISNGVKKMGLNPVSIDRVLAVDLSTARKLYNSRYVNVRIPPTDTEKGRYMRLHVVLMEKKLGRKLVRGEEVHHWGDKTNNNVLLLTLCKNRSIHKRLDRVKKNLYKILNKEYKG